MQKKLNYVLYTLTKNWDDNNFKWHSTRYNRQGLVHRIALSEVYSGCMSILSNISTDMSETTCEYKRIASKYSEAGYRFEYIPKFYIAKEDNDGFNKIIIDTILDAVYAEIERINKDIEKRKAIREAQHRMEKYEFRRGPVPNIHKCKSYGRYYRHPSTTNTKRKNEYIFDEESADYKLSRSNYKINSLPTVYDDIIRHYDKSWKTSYKVRKQWQKHIRKHVDTSNYSRKTYNMEYETED